jgi:hypothetical protein
MVTSFLLASTKANSTAVLNVSFKRYCHQLIHDSCLPSITQINPHLKPGLPLSNSLKCPLKQFPEEGVEIQFQTEAYWLFKRDIKSYSPPPLWKFCFSH